MQLVVICDEQFEKNYIIMQRKKKMSRNLIEISY